jgi:MFS family permease
MRIKFNIDFNINRVVKYFVLTDLVFLGGWGLLAPVFSIFVIEKVAGATLETVGVTAAIYWLVKSAIQLPIANFLDKTNGEKDEFYALVLSLILAALSAFAYLFVKEIWQLYLVQVLHGISFGLYVPAWSGIFSHHLDKNRYAFDWSLSSTAVGISSGVFGFAGGILANYFGFSLVFAMVGIISLAAIFLIMAVPEITAPRPTSKEPIIRDHRPPMIGK